MLHWVRKRQALKTQAGQWHSYILRRAREPQPYAENWIDDSLEGRASMVALIATLVFREWRRFGADGRRRVDAISKQIFSGFDHALREEGVGDASIARRVRKMGENFYGLAQAFDAALDQLPERSQLQAVLQRNVCSNPERAGALAEWLLNVDSEVSITDVEQVP